MQIVGHKWILISASMLLMSGCATRSWVEEYFGAKATEIDQRVATVDARVSAQAEQVSQVQSRVADTTQRVDGMGNQLRALEGSVGEVRGIATGGQERANAAYQKAEDTDSRLTHLWTNRNKLSEVETHEVLFGFNRSDLADAAQNNLGTLVKEIKGNDNVVVELAGYADPKGPKEYNIQLSQRRVEAVQRFLVEQGVDISRIHSVGLGPIIGTELSNQNKRRVTVKLMAFQ